MLPAAPKAARSSPRPAATLTKTFANRLAEVFYIMGSYEIYELREFYEYPHANQSLICY